MIKTERFGELTPDNLPDIMRQCAGAMPGPMKPDSLAWGATAGSQVQGAIRGTPLWSVWLKTIEDFLASNDEGQLDFAEEFCPPSEISPQVVLRAFRRTDLSAEVHDRLRGAVGRVLTAQPTGYDSSLRGEERKATGDALLGAMMIADHVWLMKELAALFASEPKQAVDRLWYAVRGLRRSELDAVRREISAMSLASALQKDLFEVIDYRIGELGPTSTDVRW